MKGSEYRDKLNQYKGRKDSISKLLKEEMELNSKLSIDSIDAEMALDILTLIGRQTQEKLSFRIENLVTVALEYVIPEPYKFKVEFDTKNNRTQCELYFENMGFRANPILDSGGTQNDIASVALRLAMWSLQPQRTSPVFLLDECFKHVSVDLRDRASEFLSEMCARLGLQIITVSHDESTIASSDNVIKIVKEGLYSKKEDME